MARRSAVAPNDYGELFTEYFGMVRRIVRHYGIKDDEDVASEILLRFIEKERLEQYQAHVDRCREENRPAFFSAYLGNYVNKRVLHYRDRQFTKARREPIRLEAPATADALWADILLPPTEDAPMIESIEEIRRAHDHLAGLPVRGRRDLARCFRECLRQVTLDGQINRAEIAKLFGVSGTAVQMMISDMRTQLRDIGFAPRQMVPTP